MNEQQENEYKTLKDEIIGIRAEYKKAEKVFKDIDVFVARFEAVRKAFEDGDGSTQAHIKNITEKTGELNTLKESAQNSAEKMSESLKQVNQQIKELGDAYASFSEIKGKIEGRNSEIANLFDTAKSLKKDIEDTKSEAQKTLERIRISFDDIQSKVKEVQGAYQDFIKIKTRIDDKNTGLAAAFKLVQDTQTSATKLIDEIHSFRKEVEEILDDVQKKQKNVEELAGKVSDNFKFSEEKKVEIQKATNLIIDASFAETFERRRKDIEDKLHSWKPWLSWKVLFFLSILALGGAVLSLLFTHQLGGLEGIELFIARLFYTSPLIILVAFAAAQYSKERDIAEKYAFKAASAAAIKNHIEFLTTTFGREDKQVADFVTSAFTTIYREPYKTDDMKRRVNKLEKKIEGMEEGRKNTVADPSEETEILKELKVLLPDESLHGKVVDLFIGMFKK